MIDIETTLKSGAIEVHRLPMPRSEHHLGFILQLHMTGRCTWGEVSDTRPVNHDKPRVMWPMDMTSLVVDDDDLMAIGFTYRAGPRHLKLYRLTPMYLTVEFFAERDQAWTPASVVNERHPYGFDVTMVALKKLLSGRVVMDASAET